MQVSALGMYWYPSEDDFIKMKSSSEDSTDFHRTYAEWLVAAEKGFQKEQSSGNITVVKIETPTDDFIAWCRATNRNISSHSRTSYANHKLHLLIQDGKIKV